MLDDLKLEVLEANLLLPRYNLAIFTWGNASGIDRKKGLIVIKPSGIPYENMSKDDLVVVDMDVRYVEGKWKPSSDTPTHLQLYRSFAQIGGIVHTHSRYATCFAQAGLSIPLLGTTQADYFHGDIPCTRLLTEGEINGRYEEETGKVIVECIEERWNNPLDMPGGLVHSHGPFAWGASVLEAAHNAVILEEIACMSFYSLQLNPSTPRMQETLLDRHFWRKHGNNAYYGQRSEED